MKPINQKHTRKLALVLLLALLLLLTGCPRNQPPTATDSTWNNNQWDSANWQ
jgi:outer membrane biogenesis lipoprotein LolB